MTHVTGILTNVAVSMIIAEISPPWLAVSIPHIRVPMVMAAKAYIIALRRTKDTVSTPTCNVVSTIVVCYIISQSVLDAPWLTVREQEVPFQYILC